MMLMNPSLYTPGVTGLFLQLPNASGTLNLRPCLFTTKLKYLKTYLMSQVFKYHFVVFFSGSFFYCALNTQQVG